MAEHSHVVGGSTAGRAINCTASGVGAEDLPRTESEYAARGTMLHEVVEDILANDKEPEDLLGYEYTNQQTKTVHVLTQELLDAKVWPALEWFYEVLVPDEYTVEAKVGFDDQIPGAFGTADVVYWKDGVRGIADWKFGDGVPVLAKNNDQMRFYLSAAIASEMFDDVYEGDEFVANIFQPSERTGPDEWHSEWTYTIEELDAFVERLIKAIELRNTNPTYRVGDWCRWCPKNENHVCPLLNRQLVAVGQNINAHAKGAELARLLDLADLAVPWSERVFAQAKAAAEDGVQIPGWKLIKSVGHRRFKDQKKAKASLKRIGAKPAEIIPPGKLVSPNQALALFKKYKAKPSKSYLANVERPDRGHSIVRQDAKGEPVLAIAGAMDQLSQSLKIGSVKKKRS